MTVTASKNPSKPVALIVSQARDQECDEILPVFGYEGLKAGSTVPLSVDTDQGGPLTVSYKIWFRLVPSVLV